MISAVVAALLMGGVCQQQVIQKQVVAHAPAYLQIPYVDPYWSYAVGGNEQRIRKLEEIVERQQDQSEKLATLIQALHAPRTETPGSKESAFAVKSREILAANCMGCHSGENIKGDFRLDRDLTVADKMLISEVIQSGVMPKQPAEPLSEEDAAAIAVWATEDKKAVRDFLRSKKEPQP